MGNTVNRSAKVKDHQRRRRSAKVHPETTPTITIKDDHLSSLPDCLLVSILSLLPTETAVATSVLSHRWQHLWTQLSHLSLTGPDSPTLPDVDQFLEFVINSKMFLATVDNILNHITSPKIHTFELYMCTLKNGDWYRYESLVGSWVRQVCSRHPEIFLLILSPVDSLDFFKIPAACIFQCDTLVSLNLGFVLFDWEDSDNEMKFNLPNLKDLGIGLCDSLANLCTTLVKSCPLLDKLFVATVFLEKGIVLEIFSENLKSMELTNHGELVEFLIHAPKLVNLSVDGVNVCRFRFVHPPCKLARVDLKMCFNGDVDFNGQEREAFNAISGVRSLNLYGLLLDDFGEFENGGVPVFQNLTKLTVMEFLFMRLDDLMLFLKYCPNLEVLVLSMLRGHKGVENGYEWVVPQLEPACLFAKLRVLELKNLCGTNYHLGFMEYILRKGSVLEKLLVGFVTKGDGHNARDKELEYCHKLFSYRRNSSVCEIHFSGKYITEASKGSDSSYLNERIGSIAGDF